MSAVLAVLPAAAAPALSATGDRPITKADAVIAIYSRGSGLSADQPKLVFVAWPDGELVWSEDQSEGGAPYRKGRVRPERVAAALGRLELDGVFNDKRLAQPNFGPDASFTSVLVRKGTLTIEMNSWHEIAERDGRAVATSRGIVSLADGDRLALLRKEPADYLYYRMVWGELRGLAGLLRPTDSQPVVGDIVVVHGTVSWHEGARR